MKKKVFLIIGGILIVFIGVFLSWAIAENDFPSEINKDAWLAFCGSYFGAVVSAVTTLFVFRGTIKENNITMEKERYLQVIPVMNYKVISVQKGISNRCCVPVFNVHMNRNEALKINLEVTNIGLGAAQELTLGDWHIKNDKEEIVFMDNLEKGVLLKGDTTHCFFNLDFPSETDYNTEVGIKKKFFLDVSYKDLFGNFYKQELPFELWYVICMNGAGQEEERIDITIKDLKEAKCIKK